LGFRDREHECGQPGKRHAAQFLGVELDRVRRGALRGVLQAQPFIPGQPRRYPLQEFGPGDPVRGREAFGDGVRQLEDTGALEMRAPPGLEDRRAVPAHRERGEQERGELVAPREVVEPQVRVPDRVRERGPVLDRLEGQVGTGEQPFAHDRPSAPVVDLRALQGREQAVHPRGRQPPQGPADQPALERALLGGGVPGRLEQPQHDRGGVAVVDAERERRRIQVAVVDQHVLVQERHRPLLQFVPRMELPLPGRGHGGVDEQQHVFGGGEVGDGLHGVRAFNIERGE
jgi:hypothetical protein